MQVDKRRSPLSIWSVLVLPQEPYGVDAYERFPSKLPVIVNADVQRWHIHVFLWQINRKCSDSIGEVGVIFHFQLHCLCQNTIAFKLNTWRVDVL